MCRWIALALVLLFSTPSLSAYYDWPTDSLQTPVIKKAICRDKELVCGKLVYKPQSCATATLAKSSDITDSVGDILPCRLRQYCKRGYRQVVRRIGREERVSCFRVRKSATPTPNVTPTPVKTSTPTPTATIALPKSPYRIHGAWFPNRCRLGTLTPELGYPIAYAISGARALGHWESNGVQCADEEWIHAMSPKGEWQKTRDQILDWIEGRSLQIDIARKSGGAIPKLGGVIFSEPSPFSWGVITDIYYGGFFRSNGTLKDVDQLHFEPFNYDGMKLYEFLSSIGYQDLAVAPYTFGWKLDKQQVVAAEFNNPRYWIPGHKYGVNINGGELDDYVVIDRNIFYFDQWLRLLRAKFPLVKRVMTQISNCSGAYGSGRKEGGLDRLAYAIRGHVETLKKHGFPPEMQMEYCLAEENGDLPYPDCDTLSLLEAEGAIISIWDDIRWLEIKDQLEACPIIK